MANATASSSTNLGTGPMSPSEINFEDLITVNNVLLDQSPEGESSTVEDNVSSSPNNEIEDMYSVIAPKQPQSTSTTIFSKNPDLSITQQKVVSLTKIVPKQTTTTTTAKISANAKSSNPGQVVIIQGPSGPVPIRIAGSSTANKITGVTTQNANTTTNTKTATLSPKESATNKGQPVTIQVLKMPDGSLVPLKNNKALNLTNLSNISQLNVGSGTPVIVKTTNGQKVVTGAQNKLSTGAPILKSLTLAEVQKAGFIKPKPLDGAGINKLQKILPSPTSTAASSTNASTTVTSSSNLSHKEVTIKSETDGTTKQIVVPQHMLKLQSQGGSNIQAIAIPGKPGLQYVRVLAPGSSGSGTKVMSAIKKDVSPTKTQGTGAQRVVMTSSGRPGLSLINTSKDTTATTAKNSSMRFISTVPTLRKIQDTTVSKVPSNTHHDTEISITNTRQLIPIKKINQSSVINNAKPEPKLLNSQVAISSIARQTTSSSQQPFFKKVDARATINVEELPRAKQFSTLKSPPLQINLQRTPDFTEDQLSMLFTKRSPTPEALRRKHCNCTKSQCLKLYCDCFANGEFCQDCNCKECFNNLEYEDERQKAIKICLERNPNAFKPKITKAKDQSDLRLHNKGCNCKRSGCLKNYCECYEAKIACSSNCKCFGCRNVEDRSERELYEDNQPTAVQQPAERPRAPKRTHEESAERYPLSSTSALTRLQDGQPANKQPYNFITQDVVDATIQCMIAQADECKKNGMNHKITERMIIEELGRCLIEIIDFSIRNMDN